jgi:hypothetical protein
MTLYLFAIKKYVDTLRNQTDYSYACSNILLLFEEVEKADRVIDLNRSFELIELMMIY